MKKNVLIIVLLILVVIFLGSLFIVPNMTSIIKFGGTISSLIASALAARWSGLFPWLKGLVTDKSKRAEVERDITVLEDKRKERRAEKAQAQAQKAQAQEDQLKEDLVELEKNCRSILKERFRDPEPAIPGYAATVDRDYIERHFAKDFSISVGRGMYDATYLIRRDQRQTEHIVIKRAVVFNTNTLIIGDKGSGKTFYLKRLEWEALFQDGGIRAFPGVKYPIYVDFQQFAHSAVQRELKKRRQKGEMPENEPGEESPLLEYVVYQWRKHSGHYFRQYSETALKRFLDRKLQSGEAILLVDGIDKVKDSDRKWFEDLLKNINILKKSYARTPFIITSRPGIFESSVSNTQAPFIKWPGASKSSVSDSEDTSYQLPGFDRVYMQDLRLTDIHAFIIRSTVGNLEAPVKNALWKLIERNIRLQAMAAKPLDLARIYKMCADANSPFSGGKLLQERFELYKNSVTSLLQTQEFSSKNVLAIFSHFLKERTFKRNSSIPGADHLLNLLASVAWDLHKEKKYGPQRNEWVDRISEYLPVGTNDKASVSMLADKGATKDPKKTEKGKDIFEQVLVPQGLLRKGKEIFKNHNNESLEEREVYHFSNIVFQEYLVALQAKDKNFGEILEDAKNPWWEEIAPLFLSQLPANLAMDYLKSSKPWLADPAHPNDENYWNTSLLLARCFVAVKEIDRQHADDLVDMRKEVICRLYGIIHQAPSLFWWKHACLALAMMGETELSYDKWENRRENTWGWTLRAGENFSPVLLRLLTTFASPEPQIERQFRRLLQDLKTLNDDRFRQVFRDTFDYNGVQFKLTVYERLQMLAAVYVMALYNDHLVKIISDNFAYMLGDPGINRVVRAGLAHMVGLLCNEQAMEELIQVLDWGIPEYLRWNIISALATMHSRLGVSDKLYLPEKFKGWIHNERGVSDLQAFHMAVLLISKMYYGLDHGESQSHMTFDLNGRPVDGGNANHRFENEGIYMLQGVPRDTILHGYSNFINEFANEFGKDDLDDDHFSYLLDLVSHLGESPDMLHKFEERQHWDDILKDKKNQTEWQIKWNQSICG